MSSNFTVQAPEFALHDVNNSDALMSSPFDIGAITHDGTFTQTIRIENTGSLDAANINITTTFDNADMWTLNDLNTCIGSTIAMSGSCEIQLLFHADGPGLPGDYSAQLNITSNNDGGIQQFNFAASKLYPLEFQDGTSTPISTTYARGTIAASSGDDTFIVRIKHNDSATVNTGSITASLTKDFADMWTVVTDGCTGQDLVAGTTCDMELRFNAQSGSQPSGDYQATLEVSATNTGTSSIDVTASKLAPLSFLDGALSPISVTYARGPISAASGDDTFTINVKMDPSASTSSGVITINLTKDFADMWSVVTDNCSTTDLSAGATCDIQLSFNAQSGIQANGDFQATLEVTGANTGASTIDITATKTD